MKALIYCRVSTQEQAKSGYSLDQQEEACIDYLQNNGYKLRSIFKEKGESAKTTNRPQLQKMLKLAMNRKEEVSLIVVWKLDRLSREVYDFKIMERKLIESGVNIHSVTEPNDQSSTGKLNRNLLATFAQFENDQKSERTSASMKKAVKEGRWMWKEPIGYKRVLHNHKSVLVIDENKAIYVRKAFDLAEENMYTKVEILRKLQEMGLRDIKKDKLTKMLSNYLYIGKINSSFFPDLIDAAHDPIISKDQFKRVQDVLAKRRKGGINKRRLNPNFPLKKILICGKCGSKITGSFSKGGSGNRYAYYHCASREKCSVRTPKLELEEKFYHLLKQFQLKENILKVTLANISSEIDDRLKDNDKIKRSIKKDLTKAKQRKNKLLDLLIEGTIKQNDGAIKMKEIDEEILRLESQIDIEKTKGVDIDVLLETFKHFCSNYCDWWLNTTDIRIKEKIQSIIFPDMVDWDGEVFRTGKTPLFMSLSEQSEEAKCKWCPRCDSNT